MIERFAAGAGGVENVAWQVAHELARQGEDVTVLTRESHLREAGPRGGATSDSGDRAAPHPQIEIISAPTFWQPLRVALFSKRSSAAVRTGRFDLVHGFARTRHQDLYRAGGGSHADYLRRNHSPLGLAARQCSPRHRILLALERGVFQDPHQRIQCASRLVADDLIANCDVHPDRIFLIPNAVDAERFASREALQRGAEIRARLGKGAKRIWLLPGSGWRRKGLETLLEAIALDGDPELRLWVAGRDRIDPWKSRARAHGVLGQVDFLGVRDDMPGIYQAVDGVVLPTRYDPFANITLEAAAAGRPIITSAANGAAEWLGTDIDVIPDALDAQALAASLAGFRSESRRGEVGARVAERAKGFGWPAHVDQLREEYRRIIRSRPAAGPRVNSPDRPR